MMEKKLCEISIGLGFQPWNFQTMSHNFVDYPVVKASFSGISKLTNLKILVFYNVYVQAPLLLRFFLEYPVKVSGSSLKAFLEQQYLKAFKLSHNDKIQGLNKKIKQKKKQKKSILLYFFAQSPLYSHF